MIFKKMMFTMACLIMSLVLFAQKPGGKEMKERVESMKIAFFTQALDLSADEAQVFWPVYNAFQKEMKSLHQERKEKMRKGKESIAEMSDDEIEALVDSHIAMKTKELDIITTYHEKFKEVLHIAKVARLYKAEEEFKRMLVKHLKDNRWGSRDMNMNAR